LPPPLIIEVIGDTSSLERSFKTSTLEARKFSGTVKQQAERAIVANAQQREVAPEARGGVSAGSERTLSEVRRRRSRRHDSQRKPSAN
jgi:hypothetical protein